ncbi:MAG: rhodanese-like domain-containing protein [Anaerolineae bacterium]|nr:rhodanese-like domain-containing protein [Anaerolineae bacterium]
MALPWWLPFGRVAEVAAKALHAQLQNGAAPQLVDVRQPSEFRAGHIRGAINVPIGSFAERLPELGLDPQRPVVAICLTAHRSIPAVRLLRQAGFRHAYQLGGGMIAWRLRSLPEERSAG